ncbi:MAG TPA: DUF1579 domain-containing protein [Gemmatales bacterium]|nr:DUF1579 domain-containing protein [Gemmatales bacterium]HMP18564.1 DUF1579 domain-containing protein [Gemmatales bacterium]
MFRQYADCRLWGLCTALFLVGTVAAQPPEMPKPSAEHAYLKKMVGEWDCKMKMMGMELACKHTYELVGDFWLTGKFKGDLGGMPLEGRDTLGYDPIKKKYVSSWIDNMSPHYTVMTGTWDEATKTMTSEGTGMGMDGKPTKMKDINKWKNDDEMTTTMHEEKDGKWVEMFTIEYKRVKK